MIRPALDYLARELTLLTAGLPNPPVIRLGNVARLESSTDANTGDLQNAVVLTLVNIEEEKTLKNGAIYVQNGDALSKRNPTLYLNLYLLFSCADSSYQTALEQISRVVASLQAKYVFTADTTSDPGQNAFPDGLEKIILDLFSLNFEQINHLWGIMGGKYLPSVLYKARLVEIQAAPQEKVAPVKEIKANENAF
ncbi:MAG TPA: DUF4255 domain-containing protein [Saprospiraceae bacterium]|nr:DUF4255 domain-containing protein [Saprospiraceae bacterium]HND90122.1 DUF4255 domain-containing protein [Saprospiraceae bacterium]